MRSKKTAISAAYRAISATRVRRAVGHVQIFVTCGRWRKGGSILRKMSVIRGFAAGVLASGGEYRQPRRHTLAARRHWCRPQRVQAVATITGVVLDDRGAPAAGAVVHAIPVAAWLNTSLPVFVTPPPIGLRDMVETDDRGRFRITGLPPGDYLVAAKAFPFIPAASSTAAETLATTFFPSARDAGRATAVAARPGQDAAIVINLVRVRGARIAGVVTSTDGRLTAGMSVRLYLPVRRSRSRERRRARGHKWGVRDSIGGAGSVSLDGAGTTARRRPARRVRGASHRRRRDRPRRAVARAWCRRLDLRARRRRAWVSVQRTLGVRVSASHVLGEYAFSVPRSTTVSEDGSFEMRNLSPGTYEFFAVADREPRIVATRVSLSQDGSAATTRAAIKDGDNRLAIYVAPRGPRQPVVDLTATAAGLVAQFKTARYDFQQFDVAQAIVTRQDPAALALLADWLDHDVRRTRGNVAFVFAGFGDPRGFRIVTEILADRSDRPVQPGERGPVAQQIRSDRYYAGHLLGELRDPRGVPILIALLGDPDVNSTVPWSLGQIGDRRAIPPLIGALDDSNPSVVVMAIYALETLQANEAVPRLTALLSDTRRATFGAQVPVQAAAKAAIEKLK